MLNFLHWLFNQNMKPIAKGDFIERTHNVHFSFNISEPPKPKKRKSRAKKKVKTNV